MNHYPSQAHKVRRATPNELPALQFAGSFQNDDAPRVFHKMSKSMAGHCHPRTYAKRGAKPNELTALYFFGNRQNADANCF